MVFVVVIKINRNNVYTYICTYIQGPRGPGRLGRGEGEGAGGGLPAGPLPHDPPPQQGRPGEQRTWGEVKRGNGECVYGCNRMINQISKPTHIRRATRTRTSPASWSAMTPTSASSPGDGGLIGWNEEHDDPSTGPELNRPFPSIHPYTHTPCSAGAECFLKFCRQKGFLRYKAGASNFETIEDIEDDIDFRKCVACICVCRRWFSPPPTTTLNRRPHHPHHAGCAGSLCRALRRRRRGWSWRTRRPRSGWRRSATWSSSATTPRASGRRCRCVDAWVGEWVRVILPRSFLTTITIPGNACT